MGSCNIFVPSQTVFTSRFDSSRARARVSTATPRARRWRPESRGRPRARLASSRALGRDAQEAARPHAMARIGQRLVLRALGPAECAALRGGRRVRQGGVRAAVPAPAAARPAQSRRGRAGTRGDSRPFARSLDSPLATRESRESESGTRSHAKARPKRRHAHERSRPATDSTYTLDGRVRTHPSRPSLAFPMLTRS